MSLLLLVSSQAARAEGPVTYAGDTAITTVDIRGAGKQLVTVVDLGNHTGVFEGDILVPLINSGSGRSVSVQAQSFGSSQSFSLWPGGVLPYAIDAEISTSTSSKILQAIAHWNNNSPVQIVPRSDESDYVVFVAELGCASYIGRIGGAQPIYSGSSCSTGNFIHEIGHTLGLYHEHTRPDRDQFVTANIGQRVALSDHDLNGIKALYNLGMTSTVSIPARRPITDSTFTASIELKNNTDEQLQSMALNLPLPNGLSFENVEGAGWSCTEDDSILDCVGPAVSSGLTTDVAINLRTPKSVQPLDLHFTFTGNRSGGQTVDSNSQISLTMTAVNDAPSVVQGQYLSASTALLDASLPVGTVSASDPNGDTLTDYRIHTDSPSHPGIFYIDETSGELYATSSESLATLGNSVASIKVVVSDGSVTSEPAIVDITAISTPKTGALTNLESSTGGGSVSFFWLVLSIPLLRSRRYLLQPKLVND